MFVYEDCYISVMKKIIIYVMYAMYVIYVIYVSEEENSHVRNENQAYENRSS